MREGLTRVCITSWSFSEDTCSAETGPGSASAEEIYQDLGALSSLDFAFIMVYCPTIEGYRVVRCGYFKSRSLTRVVELKDM